MEQSATVSARPDLGRRGQTIRLADGRTLGFAEYGPADGRPVLAFHGTPGSRLDPAMLPEAVYTRLGLRLITPDRPGMGLSTFQLGRAMRDWPDDVEALAGTLGLERFYVMGVSGGGPYAAACAWALPERVLSTALVSSIAQLDAPGVLDSMGQNKLFFVLNARMPLLGRLFVRLMASANDADKFLKNVRATVPPADQAEMDDPYLGQAFFTTFRESVRQGIDGLAWDARLAGKPWGLPLGEIRGPVSIWQGEDDLNAPLPMGRYLAQAIPHARAHFLPGEGHLSTFSRHMQAIAEELLAGA